MYALKDFAKPISISVSAENAKTYKRFVGLEHYDSGEPVITRFTNTSLITSNVKEFKENDILIARRNVYLKRAGIIFFAGVTSGDSIILRIYDDCEKRTGIPKEIATRLLPFVLNSDNFWAYANKHADGMNSKRIQKDTLLNYEFPLPLLSEQKVLADKLWAAYRLKESYKKLLQATDDMVKAKFMKMFSFKDLRINEAKGNFINYCYDDTSSATKIAASHYLKSGKYPIFDQSQDSYIAGFTNEEDGLCKNYPAILFGDHSRILKFIDQPFFIGADGVKIIRPKDNSLLSYKFLYYDLKFHNIPNTGYNRHFKFVKMITLTKASITEQESFVKIADHAEATKSSLRSSISSIDKVIKSLING